MIQDMPKHKDHSTIELSGGLSWVICHQDARFDRTDLAEPARVSKQLLRNTLQALFFRRGHGRQNPALSAPTQHGDVPASETSG